MAAISLAAASPALAKSYRVLRADEVFRIQRDGSVRATERLTFRFEGSFHGAYRLIPVAESETIDQVGVAENGRAYAPGADAGIGSTGSSGTYSVTTNADGWTQVAWQFWLGILLLPLIVVARIFGFGRARSGSSGSSGFGGSLGGGGGGGSGGGGGGAW